MFLRSLSIGLIIFWILYSHPAFAQDDDLSAEDREVVEMLDILENLEILEEDLEILQSLDFIGDDNED